jgi:hypothetical protein
MKTRTNTNTRFAKFILILFAVLTIYSFSAEAQRHRSPFYRGIEASFGVRAYKVESNFDAINSASVRLEGGRAGVIVGNKSVRLRAGAGFFYSTSGMSQTYELVEGDFSANFYPVQTARIAPYFIAGLVYGKNKFYGYYANQDVGNANCSAVEMPRIGASNQVRASVGAGVELKLVDQHNFVHFFSEARYGLSVLENATDAVLSNTSTSNQLTISLGVRFGAFR